MWTNVFRIGGLQHVSWFQFLPNESELISVSDLSLKIDQKDAAMWLVLSSHLQLQKGGFLSTWTNSFVGPWDPSQGLHNPDEKIKLWLFLPGRHSSVADRAQSAVAKLRVVASGIWVAPGDSEEVSAALSQSLRNRIEKSLFGMSYMRYGDVFSKHRPCQTEALYRRGQPTIEFVFAATEEAIFVHVIISAKHIRMLSAGDMESVLKHSSKDPSYRLPVIVSPHGMRGWVTGCCPNDVVKQVYASSSNSRMQDGFLKDVSQGQHSYVEVALGCQRYESSKSLQLGSTSGRNVHNHVESPTVARGDHSGLQDHPSASEKIFIYPVEAVAVPLLHTSFARSSLRRFWLQNWTGPSMSGAAFFMHCGANIDNADGSWLDSGGALVHHGYNSSSNSNNSSISLISSSSSDSDYNMATDGEDLDADADSLSCRRSGLSSNDQLENDRRKMGSKRTRAGMESFGQEAYKSDLGSIEVNTSAITGVANEQSGSPWDWDDERGMGMDIQALLSEFGDFGDFFENDALPFGEPPGTAESEALMFSGPDIGEVGSSPIGSMDVDQMILPVGLPSFDSFNLPPSVTMDECVSKNEEVTHGGVSTSSTNSAPPPSTSEFDHLIKAEALMTFASEYGAVETATSDLSSSIFKRPYCPKSRRIESSNSNSSNYTYGANPPLSPCFDGLDEKTTRHANPKAGAGRSDTRKLYSNVEAGDKRSFRGEGNHVSGERFAQSSLSTLSSSTTVKSMQRKVNEGVVGADSFLLSTKTVLATEVECILFQALMCRVRHTLLSNPVPTNLSRANGGNLSQLPGDASGMTDNISSRYEIKKKETIPVRIAGDVDGGVLDGHLNAPVGVWRSVGGPKLTKPARSSSIEISPSLSHHSLSEEGMLSYGQRHPLHELLDSMALLVQQATSIVDLALDSDCGDGPYGWLALQEHWRRGFCCGPSMVHAGCGGTLAASHSLDIAGTELVDPLSADIHASSVSSLLHTEIKAALKSAFGNLDGPLSAADWCNGRSISSGGSTICDGSLIESTLSEARDSSSSLSLSMGEPMSPAQSSAGGSSGLRDGAKSDDTAQMRLNHDTEIDPSNRIRPALYVLPSPSILVGYQDDWLKTSPSSLQLWEKAPFEPYASPKPITYYVVCPDIDSLTSAAADFFQQLGTVYEACKLGAHSPQNLGNQMETQRGKYLSSGFVLLDCPQSMKIESSNASLVGSISDYFLSLSNGWDLTSYLKSLSKAIKSLKLGTSLPAHPKEGNGSSCTVIYVVCPFPEPTAVLQTVVESCVALGSVALPSDRDRRSILQNQIGKALSCLMAVDEASASNVLVLPGFSIPKLVLQVVTVDSIFKVTGPALNELIILKETAFAVFNKARRVTKGSSYNIQSLSVSGRSHSSTAPVVSIPSMWKDCVGPRMGGPSHPREGDIDASLRPGAWDNSWQTIRVGGLNCDANRNGDVSLLDETPYMLEPLFILSEPGSLELAVSPALYNNATSDSSKVLSDDGNGGLMQNANSSGSGDSSSSSQHDGSGYRKALPSLHCCYGWTEDWRWLVCIWTDARGELLDSQIFPFGGISSRQDTKGLQCLFVQVLQQGCQLLQACSSPDVTVKPRDFVICRTGNFSELEYLEWQKAIYSVGGAEVKKWPVQLRRSMPGSSSGPSLQQQDISLTQERTLPSSPSSLYSPHSKASNFMKGGLAQPSGRKQLMSGHTAVDSSKGILQWVQSITFVAVSIDHSLHLVCQAESTSPGGTQGVNNNQPGSGYVEGFTPVKPPSSTSASYLLIPSSSMRFLPSNPLQLPTCLTAESPPLAHLLHSKGFAIPLSTGFVISKAVPSVRKDLRSNSRDEWPSVLSVSLIDAYGGNTRPVTSEARSNETETNLILGSVAAELHALSWMTISPAYLERRSALPLHCDMVLRLRRLLHFADKELSSQPDKA
ncbi:Mediator of RNA polymerase II transcription subunit 13 [Linum perenne]